MSLGFPRAILDTSPLQLPAPSLPLNVDTPRREGHRGRKENPAIVGPHSLRSANRPIAGVQIKKLQQVLQKVSCSWLMRVQGKSVKTPLTLRLLDARLAREALLQELFLGSAPLAPESEV